MKKAERLNGIIFALREHGKLTAKDLAQQFEVSERTIYRDIDALSQLKVPLIAYEGLNGGYQIDHSYFIPSIQLNESEIILLLMVLKLGEEAKFPNFSGDYQLLRSKIINALAVEDRGKVKQLISRVNFEIGRISPASYIKSVMPTIIESFLAEKILSIIYYNPKTDEALERMVSPTELNFGEGGWYISGYCHTRKERRTFRLDRIQAMTILEDTNQHLDQILDRTSDQFVEVAYTLEISKRLYRILKDNDYFKHHKVLSESDPMQVQIRTSYKSDITQLVLCNPTEVTVIEPESFKAYIVACSEALFEKYVKNYV